MIEINLPEQTKGLLEGDIFDLEDNVDDTLLAKFLFYVPTVVKEFGSAIAELRRQRRDFEKEILLLESTLDHVEAEILLELDPAEYKNESLRSAAVEVDHRVTEIKSEMIERKKKMLDLDSDIDELTEKYWAFKSLRDSLESITKLRVSERTF